MTNYTLNVLLSMIPYLFWVVGLIILSLVMTRGPAREIATAYPHKAKAATNTIRYMALVIFVIGLLLSISDSSNTPKNTVADPELIYRQQNQINADKQERSGALELKDNMRPRTRTSEQLKADHDASVDYKK